MKEKISIDEMGYVPQMRKRLGYKEDDITPDRELEEMEPMDRVKLLAGWYHGDSQWADTWVQYFESQGLYLIDNPETKEQVDTLEEELDTLTADRDKWKAMALELGEIVKDYNGYYIGAHNEALAKLKEIGEGE